MNNTSILTGVILLDSVGADYKKRKAELDPIVRKRIVQWARAAQVQDHTGKRLPLADSYIQDWAVEDGFVIVYFTDPGYQALERATFTTTLLDNVTFTQYVRDAYAVRRDQEKANYERILVGLGDDLETAVQQLR